MDPVTLMALAGGAKALGGVLQTAFSGERKAQKKLERDIEAIPEYTMSPSILQYYEQAKQRYGVSPTQTAMYKRQMQNIQRAGATGVAGLRSSRERIGGVPSIIRGLADASLGAEVAGEQEQARRFGQLGSATQMMASQEAAAEQRKLLKQQQRISRSSAEAAGRSAIKRAGLANIFGGLSDIGSAAIFGDSDLVKAGKNIPGISPRESVGTLPKTRVGLDASAARISPRSTPSSTKAFGMLAPPYVNPPYVPRRSSPSLFPTYPF